MNAGRYVVIEHVFPVTVPRTAAWVVWDSEQKVIARTAEGTELIYHPEDRADAERMASDLDMGGSEGGK